MSSSDPHEGWEKVGLRYFSPCKPGFLATATQCIAQCPDGTVDGGWWGCKKQTYQRTSHPPKCANDQDESQTGLACYDKCPNNANGVGPFCFGGCPANYTSCFGILCLPEGQSCTNVWTNVAHSVQQVIDAGMHTNWGKGVLDLGHVVSDLKFESCPAW